MFHPLDCLTRHLSRHIRQCSLHQKSIKYYGVKSVISYLFYMTIANYRYISSSKCIYIVGHYYTQVNNYNRKQAQQFQLC